jgi:hypothetical protein
MQNRTFGPLSPQGEQLNPLASAWRNMNNSFGAVWALTGLYDPPYDLRVTNDVGQQIIIP